MTSLTLSCLILGDHPFDFFLITVDRNVRLIEIKPKIIAERPDLLKHCTPSSISLWRVDILLSEDDDKFKKLKSYWNETRHKINVEKEFDGKKPNGNSKISNYFTYNGLPVVNEDVDPGYINFVVECPLGVFMPPPVSPAAYNTGSSSPFNHSRSSSAASLAERSGNSKRLKREEEEYGSIVASGLTIGGASDFGQPSNFFLLNKEEPKILIDRPFEARGPHINLFNSTFSQFLEDIENEDLDINAHPNNLSVSNIYAWTQELVRLAVDHYLHEGDRMLAMRGHLGSLLGSISLTKMNDRSHEAADGTIFVGVSGGMAWSALFEGKNECGSTKDDSILQGAVYYFKYWCQPLSRIVRESCCCPTFIITISGPYISVLGGVFTTLPLIKGLADINLQFVDPSNKKHMWRTSRFFVALSRGIENLNNFYHQLGPNPAPSDQRYFPYIRQFKDNYENVIKFNYIQRLIDDQSRAIWKAETEEKTPIVVKFVQQYHKEAHTVCADAGYAPTLLHTSNGEEEKSLGGYKAVIMNYIEGVPLDAVYTILDLRKRINLLEEMAASNTDHQMNRTISHDRKRVEDRLSKFNVVSPNSLQDIHRILLDVRKAVDLLHEQNLVFADLRAPNILAVKHPTGWSGMLIDFDWCGTHDSHKYPLCMNMTIKWAPGVQHGATLQKAHDLHHLEGIERAFNNLMTASVLAD